MLGLGGRHQPLEPLLAVLCIEEALEQLHALGRTVGSAEVVHEHGGEVCLEVVCNQLDIRDPVALEGPR